MTGPATWQEDLQWYRDHQTTEQIGFNPNGMCLKVCRTSRRVGPKYLTARECMNATPEKFRVYKVRDLRRGMKLYFADPTDSNTADHVVTMIGRVKGFDWDDLNDVLVETNSVKDGELVVVRATYFFEHWGDRFQFGAFWINDVELDYAGYKKDQKPVRADAARINNFRASGNEWDVKILDRAIAAGRRDLLHTVETIETIVDQLPKDRQSDSRIKEFRKRFKDNRVLKMSLLNGAVDDGRTGTVKQVRDDLRAAIKSVLYR